MMKTISPGTRSGIVRIPSSKSVAHRMLICAALGESPVRLAVDGISDDIRATASCLSSLGAGISCSESLITVIPVDRERAGEASAALLPAGESGSTLRFLLPVVGALGREAVFQMEGRLSERPLAPFDRLLTEHGMVIRKEGNLLFCSGQLTGGSFRLPGNISSQYFSGLLMALPLLTEESSLAAEDVLESAAYVRLTEDALRLAKVRLKREEGFVWRIPGKQKPALPETVRVEGDWSNGAFFLCMGALSKEGIRVEGLNPDSEQGDRAILELLAAFGARIEIGRTGEVAVRQGKRLPLRVDAAPIPDLVPVLAVLCCATEGKSEIMNAARLRLKESDRIHSTAELIRCCGGRAEEQPDGLTIFGNGSLRGGSVDAFHDHRIAMSAALAACLSAEEVIVSDPGCVTKSYPAFWEDYQNLALSASAEAEEEHDGESV